MHFTTILYALLPVLATAATPVSNEPCFDTQRNSCPVSSDGQKRCVFVGGDSICVTSCQSCATQCKAEKQPNGFCSDGANPCICTDLA
ncbi:hypothetical protein LX32DRAFT_643019 [Colletotrichum zoysiae]|uniref:Uncharacterized protein n=1 Tax=Colletotrichum zoysiae TaxID=1216348 RepID=A0AAD9HA71_9PEZI|nr:hypothetical protein LX32DRAFT_643019 [Colletotrichum zoysiae]